MTDSPRETESRAINDEIVTLHLSLREFGLFLP